MNAPLPRTHIVGHRGASALVEHENTLEAFARTAEVGAGWVEIDVRRLGDGTLVVHHDPLIQGTPLSHLTRDGLQRRASTLGFSVPTLEEALDFCAGRLGVDIELKEVGTEADAAALARRLLPAGSYVYTSFHDRVIAGLKLLDPEARAGLLLGHPNPEAPLLKRLTELYPLERLRSCGADFAAPNRMLVRMGLLRRLRAAGFPVWVWTVNDATRIRRLLQAGVEAIITDVPDLAVQLRDRIQSPAEAPLAVDGPEPALLSA